MNKRLNKHKFKNQVISIFKPLGLTSYQAIKLFKQKHPQYADEKISPAGRLDPMAEGILLLLLGEENKKRNEYEKLEKEYQKLEKTFCGIKEMHRVPGVVFVVDTKKEAIAVHEARRLEIPVIGMVDTNSDPDEIDYPIPANDDALRSIRLFARYIGDTALESKAAAPQAQAPSAGGEEEAAAAPATEKS